MVNAKRKLAIFMPALHGGGAQRTMLNLARGIAARGYSVDLVLARAVGPYLNEVHESVRLVDLQAGRTITSQARLARYLRSERPDSVLSALSRANVTALWARKMARVSTRIVVSERNTLSQWAQHSNKWSNRLTVPLVRRFYRWADGITAVSQGVADDLCRLARLPSDRVRVVYNPVVTPELQKKVAAPLDHPWFAPGAPPVIVAVGSLTRQKDLPTLIRAFAVLRKSQRARLIILGEGSQRAVIEQQVEQSGLGSDVLLPGWVDNPYPYMTRAALFVLSSQWEGLPGVLIEALFAGAPVVSTDCESGPREILGDGSYGQLVPVGDATALAGAMQAVLQGETCSPSPSCWRRYELDTVVDQYIDVLFRS